MTRIETGVDRLVELINKEKRISVDDAAKNLGIGKIVIQEWADFLEEEKIITIEYKFSKTFLVERKLTSDEIKVKKKEYESEKDAFVRSVESSIKNLEQDSVGLEKIKQEFNKLKTDIGEEIEKVKTEVEQLEKFEYLKKNLDGEIQKQETEFHNLLDKSHQEISIEQKRHSELIEALEFQKRDVQVKEHRLLSLEEKEKDLMLRIQEIIDLSKQLGKKVISEKSAISDSVGKAVKLEKTIKGIENNILKKKKALQPLFDKAKSHEEEILRMQQQVLEKAKEKTDAIKSQVQEGTKVVSNFETFFQKKSEVENLITKIESENKDLEESFKLLEKRALAFDIATKSNTVNTYVKELNKELDRVNAKKEKFKMDLGKLIKLVKG